MYVRVHFLSRVFLLRKKLDRVLTTAIRGGVESAFLKIGGGRFKAQAKNTRRRAFCTSRTVFCEVTQKMPAYFRKPKRMRYYQAAIDISFLDKGAHYKALNDSYIIFVCLFDAIGNGKPLYTFENICLEDRQTLLQDGTKKVIINAEAFGKTEDAELKGFLEYVKTGTANTDFTGRIETMIQAVKHNEQARKEYRFMSAFEMDARRAGIQEGIAQGRSEGLQVGIAQGSYQAKLETAKNLIDIGLSTENISKATGLSCEEIEKL